jgi:xanthosine utilization system XapX-like protein
VQLELTAVYFLLSLILVVPFACLALLCLVALLGVATIAVGLNLIRAAKSVLGMSDEHTPLSVAFAKVHPSDYAEPEKRTHMPEIVRDPRRTRS